MVRNGLLRSILASAVGFGLVLGPSLCAAGQPSGTPTTDASAPDPSDTSIAATVAALVRTIEAQQERLDAQGRQIEQLRLDMAETRALRQTPAAEAPPAGAPATEPLPTTPAVDAPPPAEPQTPAEPPAGQARPRAEIPPDVVTGGDAGAFQIGGGDASLRFGGLVRVNWVSTYHALLVDDRFQTSAIPVAGSPESLRGGRVNVIASPSRFNFDLRTPTGVGYMRAFIEGDFAGDGNTLRLRHAYGQWRRFIFGQTWSTFSDPEAEPDGIDFEGLNAIVLFRQPQIRWSFPLREGLRLAFAFEDPRPDLTGATGLNQVPDAVTRVRWEPGRGGHVQLAGVFRQLRGEPVDRPNDEVTAAGYGVNLSGRIPIPVAGNRDHLLFQHNLGRGLGRYISDLGSYGGQDGVFDASADRLRALDVWSGYVGYEHWWSTRVRSSASFGIVGIDNLDIQPDDALHMTRRATINVMWSPIPRLDLVTEFLWGDRQNKNGQRGKAAQTQIGSTFRF